MVLKKLIFAASTTALLAFGGLAVSSVAANAYIAAITTVTAGIPTGA